jgi:hypothetical protein
MGAVTQQQHAPQVYAGVKTAWKLLVQRLGGGEAAASCTRATRSMASDYGNIHSDRFVPVDVLLDAESVAGEPLVTAALARAQGYELVPITPVSEAILAVEVARLGADVADLFAQIASHLAGAPLSDVQRARALADLSDVKQVVIRAEAILGRRG